MISSRFFVGHCFKHIDSFFFFLFLFSVCLFYYHQIFVKLNESSVAGTFPSVKFDYLTFLEER